MEILENDELVRFYWVIDRSRFNDLSRLVLDECEQVGRERAPGS